MAHLQGLVSEWQLLADLSFSDLLAWVPTSGPVGTDMTDGAENGSVTGPGIAGDDQLTGALGDATSCLSPYWVCVAQVRPTTGTTAHLDDMVAVRADPAEAELLSEAWEKSEIVSESELGELDEDGVPLHPARAPRSSSHRREVIPVRHLDRIVALVSRDTGRLVGREASLLETAYVDAAEDLFRMVTDGTFPPSTQSGEIHTGPRAGDGLLRVDADGKVVYVSPNAVSAYHRMNLTGSVIGADLANLTRKLIADPFDAAELAARISGAVGGRSSLRMEVEVRAATVLFRALPLRPRGRPSGALVLVRDVTEVRRRDRALISKDATIREIHHRVKNNLQTVAALLRLQARRSKDGAVRHALAESVRRVSSIALVHDTLSLSPDDRVDLDQIVDKLVPIVAEVASAETRAKVRRIGSFGVIGAELATPIVMVLAEVVQNALEHGYRVPRLNAEVVIGVERSARNLDIRVVDDGVGLPTGFSLEKEAGLGLQIVRTLVAAELLGSIGMRRRDDAPGTEVHIRIPLRGRT